MKLSKFLKGILNCCKLLIVFKSQNKLAQAFRFKDHISLRQWDLSEKVLKGNWLEYYQLELKCYKLYASGILSTVLSHALCKTGDKFSYRYLEDVYHEIG